MCYTKNTHEKEAEAMSRKIAHFFEEWKNSPRRKPLVVQGARQVGKTYSILEFGRNHYENVAYFNFERNEKLKETFNEDISPAYLIPLLSHISGQTIIRGKTLIVFDEIQACERALASLKYFCEEAPEYHIIAAGSLLGIAVNREKFSFPVGKVDMKTMHPMDIEEFLIAIGQEPISNKIRECFESDSPMPSALHDSAMQHYRQYLVIGGMPECVMQFAETKDYILVREIQSTILKNYLADMSKYNEPNEIKKTRLAYNNVTVQLSKKNTRFQYKLVKKGGRAAEFENAIEWLNLSGICSQVYKVEIPRKPLDDNKDIDSFKIYVSDLGLLCAKKELAAQDVLYMSEDSPRGRELEYFKGGMAENYVNAHLTMNGYTTYYWESDRGAEVDFIIQRDGAIIPVEVKSADNTQAKSLRVYIEHYKPKYSVKLSAKNFGFADGKKIVPLYAVFCI
jgi:predicted AAA+ superfamily ATPase